MSPLLLVALLTLSALTPSQADVKHVLDGSAHPPHHDHHVHGPDCQQHSSSGSYQASYSSGYPGALPPLEGASNNAVPGTVAFWWADSNSPFKHAYEYFKKCSSKGNCIPPVAPGFQVPNNVPQNSGCTSNGCTVSTSVELKGQAAGSAFGPVDIKKNPFLNGQIHGINENAPAGFGKGSNNPFFNAGGVTTSGSTHTSSSHHTSQSSHSINLSGNPFFGGAAVGNQAAYSGTGQTVVTGSDGFLGVQPGVPFGNGGKTQQFPTTYPGSGSASHSGAQPFPAGQTQQRPGAQPFPTTYPGKDGKFENCKQPNHVCVRPELCLNGVVNNHGQGLLEQRQLVHYCEIGKEVCCRLPENSATTKTGAYNSQHSASSTASHFGSNINRSGFANLSEITAGKSSVPGSVIKFSGTSGLSPGSIQVLTGDEVPNPLISTLGETGSSGRTHSATGAAKVVRNTTPNPIGSVFSSTVDYSNDKLDQVSFSSTLRGPQYLPPDASPTPSSHTDDLAPPAISTYQPAIPTSRPFTRPVVPGISVVSPFVPSSPQPFSPSYSTQPRPSYTPPNQYVPPQTSSPKPFVTQPAQPVSFPSFPPRPSVTPAPYRPSTVTNGYSYSTPTPSYNYPKPSAPAYIPPKTPGYSYPTPSPSFEYSRPTPKPVVTPQYIPPSKPTPAPTKNQYIPPKISQPTPGYSYPTPSPSFEYSRPTPKPVVTPQYIPPSPTPAPTKNQYIPPRISQPTPGYSYPTPSPSFEYSRPTPKPVVTPQYIPPRPTEIVTQRTYVPPKQPTPGYSYPTPSPSFEYPKVTPKPVTPQYIPPSQPTKQYIPPRVTQGYSYPTPTPSFNYPSPSAPQVNINVNNQYIPPKPKPTNNQYLPPPTQPNRIPESNQVNEFFVPRPTTQAPHYIPPEEGQPDNPQGVKVPVPTEAPAVHASCAAALKCVQEIYCTADGFISPTPVVLTKEQELARVPTTECSDQETGTIGKCCRDPNYVDPWPSANLLNGVDNGQYREDPNLGQYFPEKYRATRSENTANNVNNFVSGGAVGGIARVPVPQPFNTRAVAAATNQGTCGVRHSNSQPSGPGPLDVNFGEIPWQAMILRQANRSLLCGGVIVKSNAVLTTANCVEGQETGDILIKGGEWKLGIDEEPLPFQIVKVAAIVRHPAYQRGSLANDLALLMLEERLRIVGNVEPICLPPPNQQPPSQQCITTGWGKKILQVHLRGAIMRSIDVNLLDSNQCSETLQGRYQEFLPHHSQNTICGYSKNDHCDVDYGSALACTNGNGQYTLAGIFSWDTGCKEDGQIGGYIAPDVEWIETTCSKSLRELKALDRQYNHK